MVVLTENDKGVNNYTEINKKVKALKHHCGIT